MRRRDEINAYTIAGAFLLLGAAACLGQDPEPSDGVPERREYGEPREETDFGWFNECVTIGLCPVEDTGCTTLNEECGYCEHARTIQKCQVGLSTCTEFQEGDLLDCGNRWVGICAAGTTPTNISDLALADGRCARTTCIDGN